METMRKIAVLAGAAFAAQGRDAGAAGTAAADGWTIEGAGFCPRRHRQRAAYTAVAADGKVSGAAPMLAREIFKRLGVPDMVASIPEYGAMIPAS